MRLTTTFALCATLSWLGCSNDEPTTTSPTEGANTESDAGGGSTTAPSGAAFDLDLTVTADVSGLFVGVRDRDTGALVAFEDSTEGSKVRIQKRGVLVAGHHYAIGIRGGRYEACLSDGMDVWYRELDAVTESVELALEVAHGADEDPRGCAVVHEPVALPAGTYASNGPILGIAGNKVVLVVSPTGRVYTSDVRIFCSDTSDCFSTRLGPNACREKPILPGEDTFAIETVSTYSSVSGTATIDPDAKTIRYEGRARTLVYGTSKVCCDEAFDVTLRETSGGEDCE